MTTVLGNIFVVSMLVGLGAVVLLAIAVGYDESIARHQAGPVADSRLPTTPTVPVDPEEPSF